MVFVYSCFSICPIYIILMLYVDPLFWFEIVGRRRMFSRVSYRCLSVISSFGRELKVHLLR